MPSRAARFAQPRNPAPHAKRRCIAIAKPYKYSAINCDMRRAALAHDAVPKTRLQICDMSLADRWGMPVLKRAFCAHCYGMRAPEL